MTTATEIIAFLRARRPVHVVEKTTGLPHGWGIWLRNAPTRDGQLTYEPIAHITAAAVAAMRARPPARPVPMEGWRAARSLLWQHWDPPPKEERGTRWVGRIGSLVLHLGFVFVLLLASMLTVPVPPVQDQEGRIQLTLIGRGTQGEGGGAGPQTPASPAAASATATSADEAPQAPAKSARRPPAAAQAAAAPSAPSNASPPAQPEPQQQAQPPAPVAAAEPAPQPPTPAVTEQPLQVTQTPQPTQSFVLPPVTPPRVTLPSPQLSLPETNIRLREVEPVETQQPIAVQQVAPRATPVPTLEAMPTQVRQREIPMPEPVPTLQAPQMQLLRPTETAAPVRLTQAAPAQVRLRDVPSPPAPQPSAAQQDGAAMDATPDATAAQSPAPASTQAVNPAGAVAEPSSTAASAPAEAPASATGTSGAPSSPVAGRETAGNQAARHGAGATQRDDWGAPGQQVADDWGAASKATPGDAGGQGLFNADGSAKLPDDLAGGGSTVKPGVPGSRQQARFDADRAGTWLDRPNIGYEPTMFDKYWLPGGSLLQDWVRRGVREMEIPIPGTSKRIRCVISVLQAGGACGVYDPNENDHPATARPPPDIPVKRHPIPVGS